MRRAITRVGAWTAVTAAAVALSWYGVRSVLRDTVFEPPRAPALGAQHRDGPPPVPPTISATARPTGPPSGSRSTVPVSPAQASSPKAPTSAPAAPPNARGKADSGVDGAGPHAYEVRGGRASFTFDYSPDSATLISATPNPGWSSKVWTSEQWIRVDFTRGTATSSIFVTWNDHPPLAETYEA